MVSSNENKWVHTFLGNKLMRLKRTCNRNSATSIEHNHQKGYCKHC